jgi:assimilatory nitrate reductase catalytic subunit
VVGVLPAAFRYPQTAQVFVPFHFAEQCINKLTLPAFDPKSREPNYKQCAVRLERFRQPQP